MNKIKIGILGYGNLGKGVENGLKKNPDMELVGIFSRRNPEDLNTPSPTYHIEDLINFQEEIDVLIMCGGSKSDIPTQAPEMAKFFNTVDSFDNHGKIPEYFEEMDKVSKENKTVSIISTGWDPGLFSLNRLIGEAVLPEGNTYTFWGKGVSQGHSDAVRRVSGVKKAVQYTIPNEDLIEQIKNGEEVEYNSHNAHKREVFVVVKEGFEEEKIRNEIVNMPDYFKGYETIVHFIDEVDFENNHQGIPHGGKVIRQGKTSDDNISIYQFELNLASNPEFTASVNIAYARACYKLSKEKSFGAKTVLDVPPGYLSMHTMEELRKKLL
ncbi:MAG: diaminopimelate dehydrogenase [Tissierellia bacterium]|nr:diaminopimelate dehydrogenase [Tissierellia bacterium]